MNRSLAFRQVHLDFHTSPHISDIGRRFEKGAWQKTLKDAAVNSVTLFSKCHHGWSYHPTRVGKIHPNLDFDLLRRQYDATKEAGIRAPIYLSAGVDNIASHDHPEWREVGPTGQYTGWAKSPVEPGFHMMDFHSPYLDYLCEQIREAVELFPDCDGIFLDIISQSQSCTRWSMEYMRANGLDASREDDRLKSSEAALLKYYRETTAAAKCLSADMPVFHNAGHIPRGAHQLYPFFSHLELESLPTGGWGYDHFPLSAKYVCNLPFEFLGMTGKFHTTWGEFGGYKHPNALRYECAAMLAFGSKCSIGDQLHPEGELDASTYEIIGEAYRDVEAKEPWCLGARQVFDVGILTGEAITNFTSESGADEGATRILLESHFLFGLIDRTMDFSRFKALILPDEIRVDVELKAKLDAYLAQGGKLVLSGESGLWKDREEFAFDLGAEWSGPSEWSPDYILPRDGLRADFLNRPHVMYERSQRIKVTAGSSLGNVYDPYFNRTFEHFCSHQHTPNRLEPSGFDCGVRHGAILYFAHPVFRHYRSLGAVGYREFVVRALREFLGESLTVETNLPSTARLTLTEQTDSNRFVLHVLYAPTISRGGRLNLSGGNLSRGASIEVIEDLPFLHDVEVRLRLGRPAGEVNAVPYSLADSTVMDSGGNLYVEEVDAASFGNADGWIVIRLQKLQCHQMVEIVLR